MKYRLPKASTQFIHTPSVCGLLWFGCFGDLRIHHTALYPCTRRPLLPRAHWRAAGSSRSSTPDGFAPQARPDPPPRTPLRRRLVSILHPGRPCAAGSSRSASRVESSAWAPALGSHCGLRGRLRHRRAARSEPIVHCRWCHAPRLSVLLARAASSASRVPSARGAPLGLAAPPPPCTLAHASASASADRLLWATSRLQLGANLAADRTGARTGASTRAALVHSRARRAPYDMAA